MERFQNNDNLLNHLDKIEYTQAAERIEIELQTKGWIDQADVARLGGVHPYDSFLPNNPLKSRAGCYARAFQIELKSGKRMTFRYNGSAHASRRGV